MWAYIIRRILATIPVMAFVALFVFSLLYLAPGDPAAVIAGDRLEYLVGAGIVADSDPASEYEETLHKGRAMRAALGD